MKEFTLVAKCLRALREHGAWAIKVHGSVYGFVGAPDIIACLRGRFLAVECKVSGKKAHPAQAIQIRRMVAAGAVAVVAYDVSDVETAIERILKEVT